MFVLTGSRIPGGKIYDAYAFSPATKQWKIVGTFKTNNFNSRPILLSSAFVLLITGDGESHKSVETCQWNDAEELNCTEIDLYFDIRWPIVLPVG